MKIQRQDFSAPVPFRRFFNFWQAALRPVYRYLFGMDSSGIDAVPWGTPFIIASNHQSMMDWSFLAYHCPYLVRFVAHREYFENPFLRIGLRLNGALCVRTDRPDIRGMRVARSVLAAGEPLVIFPEGMISRSGRVGTGQPGVIALAWHAGVPIVPVAIDGANSALPRDRWIPRKHPVVVRFGEILPPPPGHPPTLRRELAEKLTVYIEALRTGIPKPPRPW